MQTYNEKIDILQAAKRGQTVQRQAKNICCNQPEDWRDFNPDHEEFNFTAFTFRVKPQPREIFVNEYSNQLGSGWNPTAAQANLYASASRTALIRFVEVERIPAESIGNRRRL